MSFLQAAVSVGDNLYHARIDALWSGNKLNSARVVVEQFIVTEKLRGAYLLNRPSVVTGGQTRVAVGSKQDKQLRRSRREAVLALYQKVIRRIALVLNHPDVTSGKVSEGAAILEGL